MCGLLAPTSVIAHTVAVRLPQRSWVPALDVVPEPRPLTVRHAVLTVIYVFEREIRHELLLLELSGLRILYDPILRVKVSNDVVDMGNGINKIRPFQGPSHGKPESQAETAREDR